MQEVYIYDAVRTPRGRGKAGGALNEVKPTTLAAGLLDALKERNQLDTSRVDDVVLGCVSPVLDQGFDIGRGAVLLSSGTMRFPASRWTASAPPGWRPCSRPRSASGPVGTN